MVTDNDFLVDKMKSFGKVPVVVGNGVNYELFSQWLKNKDSLQIKNKSHMWALLLIGLM